MKMRHFSGLAICFVLAVQPLAAQVSIVQSDVGQMNWAVGHYAYSRSGSVQVDLKEGGGSQIWDFTATNLGSNAGVFAYGMEDHSGAPFAEAAYVFKELDDKEENWALNTYFNLSENRLTVVGKTLNDANGQSLMTAHADDYYPLPLTMGTAWTSVEVDTFDFGTIVTVKRTVSNVVDAWGTVKLPAGDFECVRLRSVALEAGDGYSDYNIKYTFLARNNLLVAQFRGQWADTTHNFSNAGSVTLFSGVQTAVDAPAGGRPLALHLSQNYPNPFNPTTYITVDIRRYAHVQLEVFDVSGRRVRVLESACLRPGQYQRQWDGRDRTGRALPSGIYFCRLRSDGRNQVRRMMLLR